MMCINLIDESSIRYKTKFEDKITIFNYSSILMSLIQKFHIKIRKKSCLHICRRVFFGIYSTCWNCFIHIHAKRINNLVTSKINETIHNTMSIVKTMVFKSPFSLFSETLIDIVSQKNHCIPYRKISLFRNIIIVL